MDREAWHATVHGVAKSRTRLNRTDKPLLLTDISSIFKFPPLAFKCLLVLVCSKWDPVKVHTLALVVTS